MRGKTRDRKIQSEHWDWAWKNRGLVWFVIRKMPWSPIDEDDMFSVGIEALAVARLNWDPSKGSKGTGYVAGCVRQSIYREIKNSSRMITVSANQQNHAELIKRRAGPNGKLSRTTRRYCEDVNAAISMARVTGIIGDRLITSAESNLSENTNIEIEHAEFLIDKIFSVLTCEEKRLFSLKYGFEGEPEHTYKEIGKTINKNRIRVGIMEKEAINKVRAHAKAYQWEEQGLI